MYPHPAQQKQNKTKKLRREEKVGLVVYVMSSMSRLDSQYSIRPGPRASHIDSKLDFLKLSLTSPEHSDCKWQFWVGIGRMPVSEEDSEEVVTFEMFFGPKSTVASDFGQVKELNKQNLPHKGGGRGI
jgi:hypothetical protein